MTAGREMREDYINRFLNVDQARGLLADLNSRITDDGYCITSQDFDSLLVTYSQKEVS